MVKILSDKADMQKHLERLVELVQAEGGFIHEDLIIRAEGYSLSIEAPPSVANKSKFIVVPNEILLPVDDFNIGLSGNDLVIGNPSDSLSRQQISIMEEMLAIYNLGDKIEFHRKTSPTRLYLEAPDIFRHIALPGQIQVREKYKGDELIKEDFLHTRVLGMKEDGRSKSRQVIMPLVDFLNHHGSAPGFNAAKVQLQVDRYSPDEYSNECFVRYSKMDAQSSLITYGFVDKSARSVLSIPTAVELPGVGLIRIGRTATAAPKKVADHMKNIAAFVPNIIVTSEERRARMSFLIIPPPEFPRSMRRVLAAAINRMTAIAGEAEIKRLVLDAERQVLEKNREYYTDMKSYLTGVKVPEGLDEIIAASIQMADHQLLLIDAYRLNALQLD